MENPLVFKNGKIKPAYDLIKMASHKDGIVVAIKAGWSNWQRLEGFRKDGLLEIRSSGPRGGKRYHATTKALKFLDEIKK